MAQAARLSMDPKIWGSRWWTMLGEAILYGPETYTSEEMADYVSLFKILQTILPCADCRKHWTEILQKSPVDATNKLALQKWFANAKMEVGKQIVASAVKSVPLLQTQAKSQPQPPHPQPHPQPQPQVGGARRPSLTPSVRLTPAAQQALPPAAVRQPSLTHPALSTRVKPVKSGGCNCGGGRR